MAANPAENQYSISFHDSAWIPILSAENVLDYFCQRTNQFYDRTCNNEVIKMQRLDPDRLQHMVGVEYALIHAQDPILYVIRKQMRQSPTHVNYLAVYYILAGVVYQAPDIGSLISTRLLSTMHKLESAFAEVQSYSKYSPAQGYSWQFKQEQEATAEEKKKESKKRAMQETSSLFQRQRIDVLLGNLMKQFPPKVIKEPAPVKKEEVKTPSEAAPTPQPAVVDNEVKPSTQELDKIIEADESATDVPVSGGSASVGVPVGTPVGTPVQPTVTIKQEEPSAPATPSATTPSTMTAVPDLLEPPRKKPRDT